MTLAAGDLVMARAFGDHRRPTAYALYVVLGHFDGGYRVRPVNRGGQHVKDKILRADELHSLASFGMRIKRLDRDRLLMWVEPHGQAEPGRSWETPGYIPGRGNFTAVDREALPFINFVDPHEKETDRP